MTLESTEDIEAERSATGNGKLHLASPRGDGGAYRSLLKEPTATLARCIEEGPHCCNAAVLGYN
jgi:hypothetical protein